MKCNKTHKATTRKHKGPFLLGLYICGVDAKVPFSFLTIFTYHPMLLFPIPTTLKYYQTHIPYPSTIWSIKTPNPTSLKPQKTYPIKYPNPIHIPKQISPHNPYSHHITPLLIFPLFHCSPWWQISQKQHVASPSSKGSLSTVHK